MAKKYIAVQFWSEEQMVLLIDQPKNHVNKKNSFYRSLKLFFPFLRKNCSKTICSIFFHFCSIIANSLGSQVVEDCSNLSAFECKKQKWNISGDKLHGHWLGSDPDERHNELKSFLNEHFFSVYFLALHTRYFFHFHTYFIWRCLFLSSEFLPSRLHFSMSLIKMAVDCRNFQECDKNSEQIDLPLICTWEKFEGCLVKSTL